MKRTVKIKQIFPQKSGESERGKWTLQDIEVEWTEKLVNGDEVTQQCRATTSIAINQSRLEQAKASGEIIDVTLLFSTRTYNEQTFNNIRIWLPRTFQEV